MQLDTQGLTTEEVYMDCKKCHDALPDLMLDPGSAASEAAGDHLKECRACSDELRSLQATFTLLGMWETPEPSPYFDQRMAVRIREEQAQAPLSWLERLQQRLTLNTGRHFRPAVAGALGFVLLVIGGGTVANQTGSFHKDQPQQVSATVVDLQILDKNDQALQEMDQMLQDDGPSDDLEGGTPST